MTTTVTLASDEQRLVNVAAEKLSIGFRTYQMKMERLRNSGLTFKEHMREFFEGARNAPMSEEQKKIIDIQKMILNETTETVDRQAINKGTAVTGSISMPKMDNGVSEKIANAAKGATPARLTPMQVLAAVVPIAAQEKIARPDTPAQKIARETDTAFSDIESMKKHGKDQQYAFDYFRREQKEIQAQLNGGTAPSVELVGALRRAELGEFLARNYFHNPQDAKIMDPKHVESLRKGDKQGVDGNRNSAHWEKKISQTARSSAPTMLTRAAAAPSV